MSRHWCSIEAFSLVTVYPHPSVIIDNSESNGKAKHIDTAKASFVPIRLSIDTVIGTGCLVWGQNTYCIPEDTDPFHILTNHLNMITRVILNFILKILERVFLMKVQIQTHKTTVTGKKSYQIYKVNNLNAYSQ